MLEGLIVLLLILWILGAFVVPVGGSLIHLLLIVVLVVIVFRVVRGSRSL